ncbi:hypothetical protein [Symbioplanes lichenis]|uniref:hypothetical protein n=1 Tax=Symbioplanes lichenis TaxID=1629072 RepID=UPI0027391C72|nr:hypothetical protein [Actinoplanes lichenis]
MSDGPGPGRAVSGIPDVIGGRADPWLPGRPRELMVSVWYPACGGGGPTAEYVTPRGEQLGRRVQPLSGTRCLEITRAYVAAFVDRHLRNRPGPWPHYAEVVTQRR